MQQVNFDSMTQLYNAVGLEMLRQTEGVSTDLWMYAEAGDGWAGDALFKIGDGTLEWVHPDIELANRVMDLWNAEDESKKWEALEFEIHGSNFEARLWYESELPPEGDIGFVRRYELIRRRFGNFKVIYPPDPQDLSD